MKTKWLSLFIRALPLLSALPIAYAETLPEPEDSSKPVKFSAIFLNITEANPGSGVNRDSWGNTGLLQLGADINLAKVVNLNGTNIHIRESLFGLKHNAALDPGPNPPATLNGHFWAQDTGSTLGGAPFPNFIPNSYLSVLTVEQKLGEKSSVEAGRMNPMVYFDHPNCENILSCQNPITIYDNLTAPPAYATWGAVGKFVPNKNHYVQVGVHEDNFDITRTTGFNWSSAKRSGWFYIGEYGYRTEFSENAYPGNVAIGLWHDSSHFADPSSGAAQNGSDGAYVRAQQVAWRKDGGTGTGRPSQYVMTFASAGYSPSSAQPYRGYLDVGANYHGLFPSRPQDHYGVKLAYLRINDNELDAEQRFRQHFSGIDYRSSNNQFRLEVNGHIEVKKGIFIEPVVQYIKNPNVQFATPFAASSAPKSGFNVGVVMFAALF